MVTGTLSKMREAEKALKASEWSGSCECVGPNIRRAICRFSTCCRRRSFKGLGAGAAGGRLGVDRKETMAIGDNWNDVDMLEWAGQGVMMGNAARRVADHGQDARLEAGSAQRRGRRGRGAGSSRGKVPLKRT
jgi:hypothetical protein